MTSYHPAGFKRCCAVFSAWLLLAFVPLGAASLRPVDTWAVGKLAEAEIAGVAAVDNPFDPDSVVIDATITAPSGSVIRLPAFWYQDFSREQTLVGEKVSAVGSPSWRLRFLPTEEGTYRLRLTLQPANETIDADVNVVAGSEATMVAVSKDKRSLLLRPALGAVPAETTDTRYLRLVGENVCWPEAGGTFDYEKWFSALHDAGANFARLWMAPWWIDFEHKPGQLTRFPLSSAWKLDRIFEAAERHGIYLMLCLDHHGMYQVSNQNWGGSNNYWKTNPYAEANGGPARNPNDFFTDIRARELYKKRLRYLIARYSWSPRLLAWQFFNEIDNTFTQQVNGPDVIAWHQLMGRWLRANDPYRHLITTSLTGGSDRPEFWSLPELDLSMYHSYSDPAPGVKIDTLSRDYVTRYGKPVMIGEFGMDAGSWRIEIDPHLRGFRQALWSGTLGGSVGTSMSWWWEDIHRDRVYILYKTLSEVMNKAGWTTGSWYPAETEAVRPSDDPGAGIQPAFNASLPLNTGRRLPLSGSVTVDSPLAAARASEQLSAFVYGTKNPSLPSKLHLEAEFAQGAKLVFRVDSVASDNQLAVSVNGVEKLRVGFVNTDGRAQLNREIDREFSVDLEPGRLAIDLENVGTDWTGLSLLRLEKVIPAKAPAGRVFTPEISALRSANRLVAYVTSPHTVFPAGALTYRPEPVFQAAHRIKQWPAGRYRVSWVFPTNGREIASETVEVTNGVLELKHPNFEDDLVCLVLPAN